jgi:hypothetical protein
LVSAEAELALVSVEAESEWALEMEWPSALALAFLPAP